MHIIITDVYRLSRFIILDEVQQLNSISVSIFLQT